ncbi:MAG: HEPN domain-containing protein [Alkaliphilus sp.]
MNKDKQREQMVHFWWEKAKKSLNSANREFEADAYDFAINRIYYAVFYGASAVLLERKMSFKKHSGVRANFHREFIKEGLLDVKWGKFYDKLFEDRQEGDYTAFIDFDKDYVREQLKLCEEFLKELKKLFDTID